MNLSQKLNQMQAIDDQITVFLKESGHLPEELRGLKKTVAQNEESLQKLQEELNACKETQKKMELDVQTNNQLIQKYKQQLNSVTNNKEYKALNSEIALLSSKNSDIEEKDLKFMEQEKVLQERLQELQAQCDKSQQALQGGELEIKSKIEAVKKQIEEKRAQRNAIAQDMPLSLVKQYVLLIKKKNRKAVAFAQKEACSECGFRLRPQLLLELESATEPKVCENCGRFLIGSQEESE